MNFIPIPATVSRDNEELLDDEAVAPPPPGFCSGETTNEVSLLTSNSSSLNVKLSDIHSIKNIISKTLKKYTYLFEVNI